MPASTVSHPADNRPLPGLTDQYGHPVTRAAIDRALDYHLDAGRIRDWSYTDHARHLRTVELAESGPLARNCPLEDVTDRDAWFITAGLTSADRADRRDSGQIKEIRDQFLAGMVSGAASLYRSRQPQGLHAPVAGHSLPVTAGDLLDLLRDVARARGVDTSPLYGLPGPLGEAQQAALRDVMVREARDLFDPADIGCGTGPEYARALVELLAYATGRGAEERRGEVAAELGITDIGRLYPR
jgi:hypothetical protein